MGEYDDRFGVDVVEDVLFIMPVLCARVGFDSLLLNIGTPNASPALATPFKRRLDLDDREAHLARLCLAVAPTGGGVAQNLL